MIELRPTTWVILGVMTLLIFVPAIFFQPGELVNEAPREYDGPVPCGPQVPDTPQDETGEEDRDDGEDDSKEDTAQDREPDDNAEPVD